ncbi:MAG TPA: SAM-dependent methyltransferase [Streptosporangiaceae bacterium]
MARRVNARLTSAKGTMRSRAEIARFFDGLELVDPGLVQPQQWRPEPRTGAEPDVTAWCGVARMG